MLEWTSGGSERTFNQSAANGRNEPRADLLILCCVRSQHKKSGLNEIFDPPRSRRNGHSYRTQRDFPKHEPSQRRVLPFDTPKRFSIRCVREHLCPRKKIETPRKRMAQIDSQADHLAEEPSILKAVSKTSDSCAKRSRMSSASWPSARRGLPRRWRFSPRPNDTGWMSIAMRRSPSN